MPFGGPRADRGDWKKPEDVLQEVVMTTTLSEARAYALNFIETKKYAAVKFVTVILHWLLDT